MDDAPAPGLGFCPFQCGGSVVVDSLFIIVAPIFVRVFVLDPCFVILYFLS